MDTNDQTVPETNDASMDWMTDEPEISEEQKTYKLRFPKPWGKETISEVHMRRPVLRDKVAAEKLVDDNNSFEMIATMLSFVLNLDIEFMDLLDSEYDFAQLIKLFNRFRDEPMINGDTLTLKYPLTIQGKKVDTLTIRRPTLGDNKAMQDMDMFDQIALLCGYQRVDLLDMDMKTDWYGLTEIFRNFSQAVSKYSIA